MFDRVLESLVQSKNPASDDVLLDALRLGSPPEQAVILQGILRRASMTSLVGVVDLYEKLGERLQRKVLEQVGALHHALREAGRSDLAIRRIAAIRLIAHARLGKLSYVLSENLRSGDETVAQTAAGALTSLARWVHRTTRNLQENFDALGIEERSHLTRQLVDNRAEIEQAIVRASDVHRGPRQVELTEAAALLCDGAGSSSLGILNTAKHRGQSALIRRVQQTPVDAESVPAFLMAASKANLRTSFGIAFSKIDEPRVLQAVLRRTHWLHDMGMSHCAQQVVQGAWCSLEWIDSHTQDITPAAAADVITWVEHFGAADSKKDAVVGRLSHMLANDAASKTRSLRSLRRRTTGKPLALLKQFAQDTNPEISRLAVRELMRLKTPEVDSILLSLMPTCDASVRRVIARAVGRSSFDNFWARFDTMPADVRRAAGRALLKLLPDMADRVRRLLDPTSPEKAVKAMQMAHELGLLESLRGAILPMCAHPNSRVRSKAVMLLGEFPQGVAEVLVEKAVRDSDARVRANAIEVMEQVIERVADGAAGSSNDKFVPVLSERARSGANRERANAIKALHQMRVGTATAQLIGMLRDTRGDHRISALWVLRRVGLWRLLSEVARLARDDEEVRVRRYAAAVLQTASKVQTAA